MMEIYRLIVANSPTSGHNSQIEEKKKNKYKKQQLDKKSTN